MESSQIFFTINKQVNYGEAIYVVFNFANWNLREAFRMECQKIDQWSREIEISCPYFEYKYVIGQYDNILEGEIVWEEGPNRSSENLKLLQMSQSKIQFTDVWEKRNLMFFLLDKEQNRKRKKCLEHDILLFGQVKALNSPVKFSNCQLSQKSQLYYINLQLEPDEITTPIQIQIYMQTQFKKRFIEIISKNVKLDFRNKPINICEEILPESKCYLLK
ncbi:unnamed protein product (macronuclear) [Paramecium tetraurelia]|uniref:CBM20 domain-containing protein n=1 Tax=Paramecium tetraurelia TaxID=5888 RepID=A0CBB8_PARTE|nr:uncharacterized protein GSPATT00036868001 [Paramecium tetraurelia]CAK68085.1 unnamed protein product [Paramecium tetraurelia]|eukprot:XP_001435482.1 hypothetical protein (macronuclear) [Paramecium tetraurelia strain d4-2]